MLWGVPCVPVPAVPGTRGTERGMRYNSRKRAILAFLASKTRPASASEIAWGVRLPYPARGIYNLLRGYAHWGLIRRWRGPSGRYQFRLADRGRARLAWIERKGKN